MAVRTKTVSVTKVEGGDATTEDYLDNKGVVWVFKPKVDTDEFDVEKSLRNQARFVAVDEERVTSYAEAMRRGDKFPPVIAHMVKSKLVISDGNHRLLAATKARKPLAVYDITGVGTQLLVQIAYEANTKHGWPTSEPERITQALWLMEHGATAESAAAALMVPRNALKKASAKATTDKRFREAGVSSLIIEKLTESVKWRLAMIYTDEGFLAMTDLAHRASLSVDQVFDLVTQINEQRSAAKQVAFVQAQQDVFAGQMADSGGGVLTRRPQGPKVRLAMAVGNLMNLPDNLETVVDSYHGPERAEAATKMRSAARRLNEIAKLLTASA